MGVAAKGNLALHHAFHRAVADIFGRHDTAAHIDGASAFSTLWRIILPLMRPVLIVNLTIVTIQTLNTFDMMQALTGGGPGRSTEVLALGVYNEIFGQQALGRGAAIGVALMVINMVVVFAYLRFLQRGEERA